MKWAKNQVGERAMRAAQVARTHGVEFLSDTEMSMLYSNPDFCEVFRHEINATDRTERHTEPLVA